jgi:hypothetical protein
MKRILLAISAAFTFATASAQLPSGSLAPNFTATDINGTTHNLYEYLQQGYTVVMDVSAAWCGPCWSYHTSGALETLHEEHGVANGGDVIVIFVEGESTNSLAQIQGSSTGNTYATFTQGDWTAGTNYAIIDNASIANLYEITYFPTVFTICPTGIVTETGTLSAAAHYQFIQDMECQTVAEVDASAIAYTGDNVTCDQAEIAVELGNLGSTTLTAATITVSGVTPAISYEWSGSLNQFESENVVLGSAAVTGDVAITITTNNDGVTTNNTIDANISLATASTTHIRMNLHFDNWPEETSWEIRNENGTVVASSPSYANQADGSYKTENIFLPSTGCYSVVAEDSYGDGMNGGDLWQGTAGNGYMYVYSVDDAGAQGEYIYYYDGSYSFSEEVSGANVNTVVGVEEVTNLLAINAYPNPTSDLTTVAYSIKESANVTFDVINLVGEKVMSINKGNVAAGNYTQQIDFSNLSAGVYMLNVTSNGSVSTLRVTVAK